MACWQAMTGCATCRLFSFSGLLYHMGGKNANVCLKFFAVFSTSLQALSQGGAIGSSGDALCARRCGRGLRGREARPANPWIKNRHSAGRAGWASGGRPWLAGRWAITWQKGRLQAGCGQYVEFFKVYSQGCNNWAGKSAIIVTYSKEMDRSFLEIHVLPSSIIPLKQREEGREFPAFFPFCV